MSPMPRRLRAPSAVLALGALLPAGAGAADPADMPAPRVVELFTSHGCSSCPPADELFAELIASDPDLVALEYHVDYWDALVHGADGSFADPFSSPAHTERQRRYAEAGLAGRAGVYTPQLVVDGRGAMVGSDARRLRRALDAPAPAASVDVGIEPDGDGLSVSIGSAAIPDGAGPVEVTLVRYHHERRTAITGGENRHRNAVNHRVVHALEPLGRAPSGGARTVGIERPAPGDGCAVLVQDRSLARLRGAALCPD